MDKILPIDFFFGDKSNENIALSHPTVLKNYKGLLNNIYKGDKLIWQRKAIRSAFQKSYTHYLLTGNTGILSNWFILLIARVLGKKVILWTHGLSGGEQGLKKAKNLLYLKLASHLFLYNERGCRIAIENGIKSSKVTPIYNSLDYEKQLDIAHMIGDIAFARNYFGDDLDFICFIGRLTKQKKVDLLLLASANSQQKYNIIIVGDGSCKLELEKLSKDLGLENRVWFYGECYDESIIATIISNSKLCVSPGNCGLNAIESLTYGTPMVTHSNLQNQMPESEAIIELCKKTGHNFMFTENDYISLGKVINENIAIDKNNIKPSTQAIIKNKWNSNNQIDIMVHYLR